MFCPSCGVTVQPGQKFCTSCGSALTTVVPVPVPAPVALTAPTALSTPTAESTIDSTPTSPMGQPMVSPSTDAAATTLMATLAPSSVQQYPATATMPAYEQPAAAGYQGAAWDAAYGAWDPTGSAQVIAAVHPFRITPLVAISSLAGVLAVASAFVTVAAIEVVSDQPSVLANEQVFKLNDFSTNHMVGVILAALLLIVGSSIGATGRRVGGGLAGGAGLALAGMMAWVLGAVTQLFDSTEFTLLSSGGSFTLTTTRDIGFWLVIVAALLGGAAFVLSFESAGHDGYPPFHAAIGGVGLLGTAMAVIGPLIPMNDAPFGDQFSNDFVPPATLLLRQLVLILIAVGGIVGFTRNRRWGLGMVLGAISVAAWQTITAATESGDIPLGYAGGNLGATDFMPHTVTIVGVVVMLLAAAGGLVLAAQKRGDS